MFLDRIRGHPIAKISSDNQYNWIGPGRLSNTPAIERFARPTHADTWAPIIGPQYKIIMVGSSPQKHLPHMQFNLPPSENNSPNRRSFDVDNPYEGKDAKLLSLTPKLKLSSSEASKSIFTETQKWPISNQPPQTNFNSHSNRQSKMLTRINSIFSKPADYSLTSGPVSNNPPFQIVSAASHLNEIFYAQNNLSKRPVFLVPQSGKTDSNLTRNRNQIYSPNKNSLKFPSIYKSEPIVLQRMTLNGPSEMISGKTPKLNQQVPNLHENRKREPQFTGRDIYKLNNIKNPSNTFTRSFGHKLDFENNPKISYIFANKNPIIKENAKHQVVKNSQPRIATDDVIYIDRGDNVINFNGDVIDVRPNPPNYKTNTHQPMSFVVSNNFNY